MAVCEAHLTVLIVQSMAFDHFLLHCCLKLNHVSKVKVLHLPLEHSFLLSLILQLVLQILHFVLELLLLPLANNRRNSSLFRSKIQSVIQSLYLLFKIRNFRLILFALIDKHSYFVRAFGSREV